MFSSGLLGGYATTLSSASAGVVMNMVFRLGVKRTMRLELDPARSTPGDIHRFMESNGRAWGAAWWR